MNNILENIYNIIKRDTLIHIRLYLEICKEYKDKCEFRNNLNKAGLKRIVNIFETINNYHNSFNVAAYTSS